MTTTNIPAIDDEILAAGTRGRRKRIHMSRRDLLGLAGRGAVVAGIALLRVFPTARPALAHDGHAIISEAANPGPCTTGYAVGHNCDPICGPSTICTNGSCCTPSGTWAKYHKDHVNTGHVGYTWRPNQCWDSQWDGWYWKCGSTRYRCHDGWTTTCSVCTFKSICRKAA